MDRSFMAVCAHYWDSDGIKVALLDLVELGGEKHTALFIRDTISDVMVKRGKALEDFDRITTDSASNFIAAFK